MDVSAVTELINNVGFPIVACVGMFWLNNKNNDRHEREINTLKQVLQDNTNVIQELSRKIGELK